MYGNQSRKIVWILLGLRGLRQSSPACRPLNNSSLVWLDRLTCLREILLLFRRRSFSLKVCCKRWRRSTNRTSCPQPHVQDRRSRRTTIAFVKRQSVSKNYFSLCKNNISSTPWMCVEERLKQEKIHRCWFVDGKVPSIRMQVKWETFSLISFLNNVIESGKQKTKNYTPCNLVLKPLLEFLKSNQMLEKY